MRTLLIAQQEIDDLTQQLVEALARLGLAYKRKDGSLQGVTVKRRLITESGGILLLELDTRRLPRGVKAGRLLHPETLHHLSAVLHYPVKSLNTTGITYAVILQGQERPRFPSHADLADVLGSWAGTPYAFPLGVGPAGPVWETLRGHYLVGGETGSGKTTWLLSAVLALTTLNDPQSLQLLVVDPKGVDFLPLAGLPNLAQPIAADVETAGEVLAHLVGEIEARQRALRGTLSRDLETYNKRAVEPLPHIVAVVDEVTDLALTAGLKSPLYRDLTRVASMGRSFGIHLILATQNPRHDVLSTLIRGNLAGRISFRVTTPEHSRVILGVSGAERLPRQAGRFLARLGDGRLRELQAPMVGEETLIALLCRPDSVAGGPDPMGLLDGDTKAMVRYALEVLGGRFPQQKMIEAGWSRRTYRAAVGKLEALGLLTRGDHNALEIDTGAIGPWSTGGQAPAGSR